MDEEIIKWLDKSGYPLEFYLISELKKRKYLCGKSEIYVDIETDKNREIDVTAYHFGNIDSESYHSSRRIIFECKKSEKPLLNLCVDNKNKSRFYHQAFHGDPESISQPDALAYAHYEYNTNEEYGLLSGGFTEDTRIGYSLVPAFGKSDQEIYSGIMGLVKASTYYRRLYAEYNRQANGDLSLHLQDRNTFELHLAALVVDAPLYDAYLSDNGGIELEKSTWSILKIQLPWNFNPHDSSEGYCIHVVTKDAIPEFLDSVELLHDYIYHPGRVDGFLDKRPQIKAGISRNIYLKFRQLIS
jgi:hypothetical protein